MSEPVILEAVRTPFGRAGGAYRETRPDRLLALTLRGLIDRARLAPERVEDVIGGTVTQTGEQGANVTRLAILLAEFPVHVPAVTLNRMCGSSQQAVHFAAQAIAAGDMRYVIAAGVESMTRTPMFSDVGSIDKLNPELWERHNLIHQGESAERVAKKWGITRAEADAFAAVSHRRAAEAARLGRNREILPVPAMDAAGANITLTRDQGIRDLIDPAKMAALPTVFRPAGGDGVVTAGNASQIADGAAAVLVADRDTALADGFRPMARFRARVVVGDDPSLQLMGIIPATHKALARAGLSLTDIDWFEVNEAFATVVLAWAGELQPPLEKVNPWGGTIAHGHPLGATGAALLAKMLTGLAATGGRFGLQVMCIGHGMATATVVEMLDHHA